MAIKFHDNIRYLMANRGLLVWNSSMGLVGISMTITVYSGTAPTAANYITNWSSYRSSNSSFLLHQPGYILSQPLQGTTVALTTFPAPIAALNTGTAAWAVMWIGTVPFTSMNLATTPGANYVPSALYANAFMIVDVSTPDGNGIIKFSPSLNFVTGQLYTATDGAISVSST